MGIPRQVFRQEADVVDGLFHLFHPLPVAVEQVEIVQALRNDIFNGRPLIQGRCGILEYHLDLPDDFPVL